MNAKFEKWFYERNPDVFDHFGVTEVLMENDDGSYVHSFVRIKYQDWQAAIQSLEVTPELEDVAMNSLPQSVVEEFGYDYLKDHISNALEAVLSALKEQAK